MRDSYFHIIEAQRNSYANRFCRCPHPGAPERFDDSCTQDKGPWAVHRAATALVRTMQKPSPNDTHLRIARLVAAVDPVS
jgi:hypothetical protein